MNQYTNTWYDLATAYVQKTCLQHKDIPVGYNKDNFAANSDNTLCTMNNTIIALIVLLHNRLDSIETRITKVETQLKDLGNPSTENGDINQLIDKVSQMNLGSEKPKRSKTTNFLMFKTLEKTTK